MQPLQMVLLIAIYSDWDLTELCVMAGDNIYTKAVEKLIALELIIVQEDRYVVTFKGTLMVQKMQQAAQDALYKKQFDKWFDEHY